MRQLYVFDKGRMIGSTVADDKDLQRKADEIAGRPCRVIFIEDLERAESRPT